MPLLLSIFIGISCKYTQTCADPEGGAGGPDPPPLKNHKFIGILSNTGPDPLKKSQSYHVGPSSFKWRFAGGSDGPILTLFGSTH